METVILILYCISELKIQVLCVGLPPLLSPGILLPTSQSRGLIPFRRWGANRGPRSNGRKMYRSASGAKH